MVLTQYTFRLDQQYEVKAPDANGKMVGTGEWRDVPGVSVQSIQQFMSELGCRHLIVREIAEDTKKLHYQGFVWLDCSYVTWTNKIKARWPFVKGERGRSRGLYAGAPVRLEERYYRYICKGQSATQGPDVITSQFGSFEEFDVSSWHRAWWSSEGASTSKKQHIVEEGIARFSSYDWSCDNDDLLQKRREVTEWVIDKYKGRGENTFLIKNYVNGILCFSDTNYKRAYINQIAECERW
jgi:hypothetical protein